MKTHYSNKEILYIAFPMLVSLLMEQMIGMTDTAFLGRVGEVELAASAIAGVFYTVIFMVAFGFSIGAQILMARRNGEGRYRDIGVLFYQGIYFQIGMATVMFVLTELFAPVILRHIIASPEVCQAALSYLHWRVFGAFFSFNAVMFRAFFLGTTQTRTLTLNSIVMVLSNIVFNYLLIFGNFGFPKLGIAGAAIGSSLAEGVSLVFFILYTRYRIDGKKFGLDQMPRISFKTLRHMLSVSLWTMIQNTLSLGTWFLFFLYIEHLGTEALAVTNIVRSVSGLLYMMTVAFAATCGAITSNVIGAGEPEAVPGIIWQHIKITFAFVIPLGLIISLFPHAVLSIYTDIEHLRQASIASLWVMVGSFAVNVPAYVYFQSVSGTGNTKTALFLESMALLIYAAYITWIILIMKADVAICWSADYVYAIAICTFCAIYIKRGQWKLKQI